MAITIGASVMAPSTGSSVKTVSVVVPASAAVGDLLLFAVTQTTGNVVNWTFRGFTGVTGWSDIGEISGTSGIDVFAFHKICASGDPGATLTFTWSDATSVACGAIACVLVLPGATFFAAAAQYNPGSNQAGAAAVAGCPPNSQVVVLSAGGRGATNAGANRTAPTGWTVRTSLDTNSHTTKQYLLLATKDALQTGDFAAISGAPGFDDVDQAATCNRATWTIVVQPVAPPSTGRPKAYVAGAWVPKPAKVNLGAGWVEKPMKRWNGTAWVPLT